MRLWAINNLKRATKTQQLGPSWIKIHFLDHKLEMAQRRPEKTHFNMVARSEHTYNIFVRTTMLLPYRVDPVLSHFLQANIAEVNIHKPS